MVFPQQCNLKTKVVVALKEAGLCFEEIDPLVLETPLCAPPCTPPCTLFSAQCKQVRDMIFILNRQSTPNTVWSNYYYMSFRF